MAEVSVIVPNYNHAHFLKQRLDSLLQQSYVDFEIIVLDDASTDSSAKIIEQYRNNSKISKVLVHDTNSGSPFKQWRKGIEHASGNFIWIAESDDYSSPGFLKSCMEVLNQHPETGVVYTQSVDVDSDGEVIAHRISYTAEFEPNIWEDDFCLKGSEFVEKYLSHKNVIPNASAVVFRKSLLTDMSVFEAIQDMKMCGDWFFWLSLVPNTKVSFVSEVHNYFRQHPSMSRRQKSLESKKRRIIEEFQVRNQMLNNKGVNQSNHFKKLMEKWFGLSDKWSFFRKDFYKVKDPELSQLAFGYRFLMYKLKNRSN